VPTSYACPIQKHSHRKNVHISVSTVIFLVVQGACNPKFALLGLQIIAQINTLHSKTRNPFAVKMPPDRKSEVRRRYKLEYF
jgi:hypothetical protein